MVSFYDNFEVNDFTGEQLTQTQTAELHYKKVQQFQRVLFQEFPELKNLAISSVSQLENRENVQVQLERVSSYFFFSTIRTR